MGLTRAEVTDLRIRLEELVRGLVAASDVQQTLERVHAFVDRVPVLQLEEQPDLVALESAVTAENAQLRTELTRLADERHALEAELERRGALLGELQAAAADHEREVAQLKADLEAATAPPGT